MRIKPLLAVAVNGLCHGDVLIIPLFCHGSVARREGLRKHGDGAPLATAGQAALTRALVIG